MSYPFKMPKNTPALTYEGLRAYAHGGTRWIGTVAEVQPSHDHAGEFVTLSLGGEPLARISAAPVQFLRTVPIHQATREWLAQIVADNGLGATCFRGRGGKLCIDGDESKPVEGVTYSVADGQVSCSPAS